MFTIRSEPLVAMRRRLSLLMLGLLASITLEPDFVEIPYSEI